MPTLFEATTINGLSLKNRFVRSATHEAKAGGDGEVTDRLIDYLVALARGGVGLIITGHASVCPEGQASPHQLGIYDDSHIRGLRRLTTALHDNGGVCAAQLAHAGLRGIGGDNHPALGPAAVTDRGKRNAAAMNEADLRRTVAAFAAAAGRAREAGFDAVQIHAAHGYLLSQFLSPHYNTRDDDYGGPLANRARLLCEVYAAIRKEVGPSFPVLLKINAEDFLENGLTADESLAACRLLADQGIDAVEMSGGTIDSGKNTPWRLGTAKEVEREVYYRRQAAAFKKDCGVPLILVGGFLSFASADEAVRSGLTDYVALSRPLIREPDLIARWAAGDTRKAECSSCNRCFATNLSKEGLFCAGTRTRPSVPWQE
ncbi:MAG: NADH:flavin oxidoreductase [Desulfobulbus sp.]|jgi:2,4-dienoyl-CoA reductase-like NADH-dependent reductase (Old Yellow Enzyme family)